MQAGGWDVMENQGGSQQWLPFQGMDASWGLRPRGNQGGSQEWLPFQGKGTIKQGTK